MISRRRRGFLIGTGGLLTAAFVEDAKSFVLRNEQPLLVAPSRVVHTLYWYADDERGLVLTLGRWDDPLTWRKFFVEEGIAHQTESDSRQILEEHNVEPENYDEPVYEFWWDARFDFMTGPPAKACHLLRIVNLGPPLPPWTDQPHLVFCGGDPADEYSRWVDARDHLTLSLLQARLIDLNRPIKIEAGGERRRSRL